MPGRVSLLPMALAVLLGAVAPCGHAELVHEATGSVKKAPLAPGRSFLRSAYDGASEAEPAASVFGTVLDANGGAVANATVTLTNENGTAAHTLVSGSTGEFDFRGLAAGAFDLSIASPGMQSLTFSKIRLRANERREMPRVVMEIAGTTTEVQVVVTKTELAQEQVKAAERQRVFGVLPNFYSSYLWDAEPLNTKQKFSLAFHSITDPIELLGTGVIAGAEQANNTFPGYGQGAAGYAKRYGAAYTDDVVGRLAGSAILPSLLHQDPRYFYRGSGSARSRAYYAVTRALVTRGDNGQAQPNYSLLLGSFAAGGLANLYYPRSDRGLGLTLGDGFVSIAGHAVDNLIREFFLRRLTPNVPDYEKGKH